MIVCAAWIAPAAAHADPARASLAWVRGEGADACPDAAALRAAVARRLGYDPTTAADPSLSVEATVTRAAPDAPWSAALFVRGPDGALLGERHLDLPVARCAPVVDALALSIAAALDGDAPAPPPPAPAPPPAAAPAVVAPPVDRPRPRRAPRWGVAVSALGGVTVGALPFTSAAMALVVELRPPRWPTFVLSGMYHPEVVVDLTVGRAAVRLAVAGLAVCPWRGARGSLALTLCAGVLGGALVAAGQSLVVDRVAERPYLALEAGARARWSAGRYVHLVADAHAVVPLVRDTLTVDGVGEVARAAPLGLRATIGLGVHFE